MQNFIVKLCSFVVVINLILFLGVAACIRACLVWLLVNESTIYATDLLQRLLE